MAATTQTNFRDLRYLMPWPNMSGSAAPPNPARSASRVPSLQIRKLEGLYGLLAAQVPRQAKPTKK